MNRIATLAPLSLALVLLAGCGPTAEDEANMKEKMELEGKRAKILMADMNDCQKLGAELKAFKEGKDGERLKALDPWWGKLGKGAKDKLVEAHKAEWNEQTNAMVQGGGRCIAEFKANF